MNKNLLYILLDAILVIGIVLNFFIFPDKELVGIIFAALVITLLHQRYDERTYFKDMFDQGRPGSTWGWTFLRWLLTFSALIIIIAGLVDYFR